MKSKKNTMSRPHRRMWYLVFGVLIALTVVWLMGTATFMFNVKDTRFVLGDMFSFGVKHNCFTAYATAAYLASTRTDNIYSTLHYSFASPSSTPIHKSVRGIFRVDEFLYPPQFLILPYGLLLLFKSFFPMRAAWFVLTVIVVITVLAGTAWWCGAFRSQPRLLLFPFLLCAPTVHTTFQIGNAHILIVAISTLAMIAFDEEHPFAGGALLGFVTVAKIWPAVLVVHLLIQRRWKAVASCALAMAFYTLAGMMLFGLRPYQDYLTHGLSRVSSGDAFSWMGTSQSIIENMSIFGLPHKLYALKLLPSQPALFSPVLGWSFTVVLGVIVLATGLRHGKGIEDRDTDRLRRVQLWLVLLTLVQLRSPFLPWHYGVISTLWLLLLLAASMQGWKLGVIAVVWICLATNIPIEFLASAPGFHLVYTTCALFLLYGTMVVSLKNY